MIAKMKKVSVITLKTYRNHTLEELRKLGVVHIFSDRVELDSGDHLKEQQNLLQRCRALIPPPDSRKQKELATQTVPAGDAVVDRALEIGDTIITDGDRRAQLDDERDRLLREIERIAPWGSIDPDRLQALQDQGVDVRLFEISPDRVRDTIAQLPRPITISTSKTTVRVMAVSIGDATFPDTPQPFPVPDRPLEELQRSEQDLAQEIHAIDLRLVEQQDNLPLIEAALDQLEQDLEFARVAAGMGKEKTLQWITGFVPFDQVDTVREAAPGHGWGIVVRDPDPEEHVPTQLRNSKPVRIIRPVFDLLGTVPGYRELDISFFFLLFFVVFFAMIIGDGGYGLILLAGTLFGVVKTRKSGGSIGNGLVLMSVLSIATVVWGAITGNWFGYAPFNDLPILGALVVPELAIDNEASRELIQFICFVIGTVHLSIAHIWKFFRAIRRRPRIAALEQLGWLSMVLGLYYLVLQLVIDPDRYPMPDFAVPMIAGGLVVVILFGAQEAGRNFFVGVGKGLAGIITTILDSIGAFSDIISYIRLFAVGLATLAIAQAFNSMAGGVSEALGGAGGAIAAVLIILLGHTLNLAMGALSVVVHGVRLNMLEFSGHLGMEWTGVEYTPFKTRS